MSGECAIFGLSSRGFGLGREATGREIEVPFTAPGDEVLVSLPKRKRRGAIAYLEKVVVPGPEREAPRCLHFGKCGGCRLQHLPYTAQLRFKEESILRAFQLLKSASTQVLPIIACDPPWNYRNKMEFSFSSDAKGTRYLGLMLQQGRGRVFHLEECHLANPWMAETLVHTRKWWDSFGLTAYHPYRNSGTLRTLILREGYKTGDRLAMMTVSGNPEDALSRAALQNWVAFMSEKAAPAQEGATLSLFLRIQQIAKGRPTQFFEMLLHGPDHIREQLEITQDLAPAQYLNFHIAPSAFFQPNPRQAEKLYSRALALLKPNPEDCVYDLCCGTGTLGIAVSRRVREVIGIELSPESAIDARTNAHLNGCSNVTIHTGDVGEVLARLEPSLQPKAVIVDPPRAGLSPLAIAQILSLKPYKILYISCNPQSQARDLQILCGQGYSLSALQPVDQFPQTIHVENIAVLERVP